MSPVHPRALVHQGRHSAAGLLLEASLVSPTEMRRRILRAWRPGDVVRNVEGGLLHLFAQRRLLDAAEADGHLLLLEGGVLLALPLTAAERRSLAPAPGEVVLARGGEAVALRPGVPLDPAAWLALAPALVPVTPLGALPSAPALAPAPPEDLRETLSVPAAASEAGLFARALQAALDRKAKEAKPMPAGPASLPAGREAADTAGFPSWLGYLLGLGALRVLWGAERGEFLGSTLAIALVAGLTWLVGRLLFAPGRVPGRRAHRPAAASAGATRATAHRPGPFRAIGRVWDRLLVATQVARLAGLRQSAYLMRLFQRLDHGDLDEALRTAIPLGNAGEDGRLSLGVPGRRSSLSINFDRTWGPAVSLGGSLVQQLRLRYRRAFERLSGLGRHDEAAFVLAELLRSEEEAVGYLERHGRLRQAAELAEGRGLAPGLVIRQWFVAGDHARAIRLARALGQWADAVSRLERSGRGQDAEAMRLRWADDLAEAGDLHGAARAALPVPLARPLVERWIELAVASGGPAREGVLGIWAQLRPDRFEAVREWVLAACADGGPEGLARRREVARGLLAASATGEVKALARPVYRSLRVDEARRLPVSDLGPLGKLANDLILEADRPPGGALAGAQGPVPFDLAVRADDRGTRSIQDAAALPGGRILVGLGEGGVRLLTRDGREVARFDVPTHRLVVSDLGTRVLAVGRRGEVHSVARLDLDARTAHRLRDLKVDGFARSFDGVAWAVSHGREVLLLDTLRDDLRTLWHIADLPGAPVALERARLGALAFVVHDGESAEGWSYQDGALRERVELDLQPRGMRLEPSGVVPFIPEGAPVQGSWHAVFRPDSGGGPCLVRLHGRSPSSPHWVSLEESVEEGDRLVAVAGGLRPVVAYQCRGGVEVRWFTLNLAPIGRLRLDSASAASLRVVEELVTVADDAGRVVAVDVAQGRVVVDLRV